jgi:ribosomal protein L11 methyltransferase
MKTPKDTSACDRRGPKGSRPLPQKASGREPQAAGAPAPLLTVVSCAIAPDKVDALFELLDPDAFTPTSWLDLERGTCRVDVFLEDSSKAPAVAAALKGAGALLGLTLDTALSTMARDDWANGWKRYFHAEKVSDRLVVCPTWEKYDAKPGERILWLDPGMSFGTGKHETTQGCLKFLDRLAAQGGTSRSVLDMGCGTGILSIGAKLLGFTDVRAFDIDPDCIGVARENAAANNVEFPVTVGDISKPWPAADIVLANILAPILIEFAAPVAASVAEGGRLVLSGILDEQYAKVRAAYEAQGLKELGTILLGEWRCGLWERAG